MRLPTRTPGPHVTRRKGKLRISALDWYQAHVLKIDINAIHGRLENSTSFTGSQAVFSEHFFHLPVLHLPVLWVTDQSLSFVGEGAHLRKYKIISEGHKTFDSNSEIKNYLQRSKNLRKLYKTFCRT